MVMLVAIYFFVQRLKRSRNQRCGVKGIVSSCCRKSCSCIGLPPASFYFACATISAYMSSGILSEKLTAMSMILLACSPGKFLKI